MTLKEILGEKLDNYSADFGIISGFDLTQTEIESILYEVFVEKLIQELDNNDIVKFSK